MNEKIAVHPGYIISINDGQEHFIGFIQLCQLHKINHQDAICWDLRNPETFQGRRYKDYKHYFPSSSGTYGTGEPHE